MAKKQYFMILDTETTIDSKVYDFAAIICDRNGKIYKSCAVIIGESADKDLFYDANAKGIWSKQYAVEKKNKYKEMLISGSRMLASVNAVNRWLEKARGEFDPIITAYNVAFDREKCQNTGIDLSIFSQSFCLWHLACAVYAKSKAYRSFILENHYFGERTKYGNLTYKTNAEVMAHFITGEYSEEPHTALEDAQFYELPILVSILKKKNWKDKLGYGYNWKDYQVKDNFSA